MTRNARNTARFISFTFPYAPRAISEIKSRIHPGSRSWDSTRKAWGCSPALVPTMRAILTRHGVSWTESGGIENPRPATQAVEPPRAAVAPQAAELFRVRAELASTRAALNSALAQATTSRDFAEGQAAACARMRGELDAALVRLGAVGDLRDAERLERLRAGAVKRAEGAERRARTAEEKVSRTGERLAAEQGNAADYWARAESYRVALGAVLTGADMLTAVGFAATAGDRARGRFTAPTPATPARREGTISRGRNVAAEQVSEQANAAIESLPGAEVTVITPMAPIAGPGRKLDLRVNGKRGARRKAVTPNMGGRFSGMDLGEAVAMAPREIEADPRFTGLDLN